ncbi:hypothetical protein D0T84_15950 [Dysgonomonas sp. 521]|uniref:hypothetical protein n=1 Tax=Dysgonomonas sp. 521 TaxID=2302932 RepID=UPI0013D28AD9|nr:hypothetical protein [Dysgonomonas sp. 521]NDV96396.1 hypothetical protein [Dysgonomonas sp. 521]
MMIRLFLRSTAGIFACLLIGTFISCKTNTVYVPVETIRIEYRDKLLRDSVRLYDSVFVMLGGDTVRIEKYKYLYRDRLVRDSIFRTDTISVPYPVVEVQQVNRLTSFQSFQVWCGRILLMLILICLAYRWLRKK